ncbi:MAG: hypothetical protein ACI4DY_11590, partial [Monoglobaceae bacterium]
DIKEAMERDHGKADIEVPKSPVLQNIGMVELTESAGLFDNLHIGQRHKSVTVESMEEFDQIGGYILYSKIMTYDAELNAIKIAGLHDRAHIFVNKKLVAVRMRGEDESVIELPYNLKTGDVIDILVENMGRICYGEDTYFGDRKGICGGVFLTHRKNGELRNPGKAAFNWDITCLEMDNVEGARFKSGINTEYPLFFRGTFNAKGNNSCFIHFDNFIKGVVFVNGFNLGRYWDRGPLEALYVPGAILNDENEIVIFETEGLKGSPTVEINDICGIPNHHKEIIV